MIQPLLLTPNSQSNFFEVISVKSNLVQFQIHGGGANRLDGNDSFDFLGLILVHLIHLNLNWIHGLLHFLLAFIHPLNPHHSNRFVHVFGHLLDSKFQVSPFLLLHLVNHNLSVQ